MTKSLGLLCLILASTANANVLVTTYGQMVQKKHVGSEVTVLIPDDIIVILNDSTLPFLKDEEALTAHAWQINPSLSKDEIKRLLFAIKDEQGFTRTTKFIKAIEQR